MLINMGCFPFLGVCLVTLPLSLAMLFGSIILQHLISYHVWDNCIRSYQVKRQNIWMSFYYTEHIILELQFICCDKKTTNNESHTFMVMSVMSSVYIRFHSIRPCWSTLVLLNNTHKSTDHRSPTHTVMYNCQLCPRFTLHSYVLVGSYEHEMFKPFV